MFAFQMGLGDIGWGKFSAEQKDQLGIGMWFKIKVCGEE